MKKTIRLMSLLLALIASTTKTLAQTDDLQNYLDRITDRRQVTRAASEPTVIDLSTFSATDRSTTLYIRGGINVKFINGTLNRTADLEGSVVSIIENSSVELGEEGEISCNSISRESELVNVTNGTFKISAGKITALVDITPTIITRATQPQYSEQTAVKMETGNNSFIMTGGSIDCYRSDGNVIIGQTDAYVNISGGSASIKSQSNIVVSGTAMVGLTMENNTCVDIEGSLENFITIRKHSVVKDDVVAKGVNGYILSESDMNHFGVLVPGGFTLDLGDDEVIQFPYYTGDSRFPNNLSEYIYLKENKVYVGRKPSNAVYNEDDLQRRLNEIAEKGIATREQPDTVIIAESGVNVQNITVPENCFAVITGGSIKILQDYGHYAFRMTGDLTFENITIDISATYKNFPVDYYFYLSGFSMLTIGENVNFIGNGNYSNAGLCYMTNGSCLTYKSGHFQSSSPTIAGYSEGEIIIEGSGILESSSLVIDVESTDISLLSGKIIGHRDMVVKTTGRFSGGDIGPSMYTPEIIMQSTFPDGVYVSATTLACGHNVAFTGNGTKNIVKQGATIEPNSHFPVFYLEKDATVHLTGPFGYVNEDYLTFDADWSQFELEKMIIGGANFFEDNYITFLNMPADREAYYKFYDGLPGYGCYSLRKVVRSTDDLQGLLELLAALNNNGTENDPEKIPVGNDGLDFDDDVTTPDDLQIYIDGQTNNSEGAPMKAQTENMFKTICFNGGNFNVPASTSLRLMNICLQSGEGKGGLIVGGKLFLDNNVMTQGDANIIILKKGGLIGVAAELKSAINISIDKNNISLDTPVITSNKEYILTQKDMKLISISLPIGYETRFDNGCVYITQSAGINSIRTEASISNCYDISGKKIVEPRKGVNILRMSDGTTKKIIK